MEAVTYGRKKVRMAVKWVISLPQARVVIQ
jgi:hypothetical protein